MENEKVEGIEGFDKMSDVEQLKLIEEVIDAEIRPMLAMDGGGLDVIDMHKNDKNIDIYIRYLGNCSGCAMGTTGTLFAMEGALKKRVSPLIRILPI